LWLYVIDGFRLLRYFEHMIEPQQDWISIGTASARTRDFIRHGYTERHIQLLAKKHLIVSSTFGKRAYIIYWPSLVAYMTSATARDKLPLVAEPVAEYSTEK
jgi:hypothetical protein